MKKFIGIIKVKILHKLVKISRKLIYFKIVFCKYKDKEKFSKEIAYLKNKKELAVFPYKWTEKYKINGFKIYKDKDGDYYTTVKNKGGCKRLYLCGSNVKLEIAMNYNGLCMEQDKNSPHKYFTEKFYPSDNDIFVDVGTAEGKEALEVADYVSEIHLFEYNKEWINMLKKTFMPYKEKNHIYQKIAGKADSGQYSRLDTILNDRNKQYFIKLDVEGAELEVLNGAQELLKLPGTKVVAATYHNQNDADDIRTFLEERGFKTEYSNGVMLFIYGKYKDLKPPYFRKGVIRAWKHD